MNDGLITSSRVQRLLLMAVLLLVVLTSIEISARIHGVWASKGFSNSTVSAQEIAGEQMLSWEFAPPPSTLSVLWLFGNPIEPENDAERIVEMHLSTVSSSRELISLRRPLSAKEFEIGEIRLEFDALEMPPGERLRLTFGLPEAAPSEGMQISYLSDPIGENRLLLGSEVIENANPTMVWIGEPRGFPILLVEFGILLLIAQVRWRTGPSILPQVLVLSAVVLLIAGDAYEQRVHQSWVDFWPDGYVSMAQNFFAFFSGESTWAEMLGDLKVWQNGQVFFIPVLIAAIQVLGFSAASAFQLLVVAFVFASILIFFLACREFGAGSKTESLAVYAAVLTSLFLLRAAGSFQTDIGGVFFSLLSILLVYKLLAPSEPSKLPERVWPMAVALALSLILGSLTRVAVLPLVALPACAGLWDVLVVKTGRPWRSALLISISLFSGLALLLCWYFLDLFETFERARAFSALPIFRDGFSWSRFLWITWLSCSSALIAIVFDFKRLFRDPQFAALAGGVCALLLILAVGKIVPWHRYWSPIFLPALYLGLVFAYSRPHSRRWVLVISGLAVYLNVHEILVRNAI